MNWLAFVAIAVLFDSTRIFIDNYTSDVFFKGHSAVSQKLFYGYASIICCIIILLITRFDILHLDIANFGFMFLSGAIGSLAGIPYYKALEIDDSTNIGIFTQLAPVFYLILGWLFLGESISGIQLIAFLIILSAPLLILLTSRKRSRKIKLRAIILALIYVVIAVISNLIFIKNDSEQVGFPNEIAFMLLGKGIANLIIIYTHPKWKKRFRAVFNHHKKAILKPLIANSIIGVIKDLAYRSALIAAPAVALASAASDSAEPIAIFFMGIVLTLIWPKFGREKLNKKSVLIHLAATILIVAGVILLQF